MERPTCLGYSFSELKSIDDFNPIFLANLITLSFVVKSCFLNKYFLKFIWYYTNRNRFLKSKWKSWWMHHPEIILRLYVCIGLFTHPTSLTISFGNKSRYFGSLRRSRFVLRSFIILQVWRRTHLEKGMEKVLWD